MAEGPKPKTRTTVGRQIGPKPKTMTDVDQLIFQMFRFENFVSPIGYRWGLPHTSADNTPMIGY